MQNEKAQGQTVVLEPSTNTHEITNVTTHKAITPNLMEIECGEGATKLLHGEHGVIGITNKHLLKTTQQELDPIDKAFRNAYD